jgi:hypothetical protein
MDLLCALSSHATSQKAHAKRRRHGARSREPAAGAATCAGASLRGRGPRRLRALSSRVWTRRFRALWARHLRAGGLDVTWWQLEALAARLAEILRGRAERLHIDGHADHCPLLWAWRLGMRGLGVFAVVSLASPHARARRFRGFGLGFSACAGSASSRVWGSACSRAASRRRGGPEMSAPSRLRAGELVRPRDGLVSRHR